MPMPMLLSPLYITFVSRSRYSKIEFAAVTDRRYRAELNWKRYYSGQGTMPAFWILTRGGISA